MAAGYLPWGGVCSKPVNDSRTLGMFEPLVMSFRSGAWLFIHGLVLIVFFAAGVAAEAPQVRMVRVQLALAERGGVLDLYPRGLGSGLFFLGQAENGDLSFYTCNAALPAELTSGRVPPAYVAQITVRGGVAVAHKPVVLPGLGADCGAVALAPDRSIWMATQQGVSLLHLNAETGKILEYFRTGAELPEVLGERARDRGFGALVLTPRHEVVAILRATLDIGGRTAETAPFVRMLRLAPATGKFLLHALPIDGALYPQRGAARIVDAVGIDEQRLLVLEQRLPGGSANAPVLYLADTTKASDLQKKKGQSQAPELVSDPDELFGKSRLVPRPVQKKLVLDLREAGWSSHLAGGLALLKDKRTLVISTISENPSREGAALTDPDLMLWFVTLARPVASAPARKTKNVTLVIAGVLVLAAGVLALKLLGRKKRKK